MTGRRRRARAGVAPRAAALRREEAIARAVARVSGGEEETRAFKITLARENRAGNDVSGGAATRGGRRLR